MNKTLSSETDKIFKKGKELGKSLKLTKEEKDKFLFE